MRTTAGAPSSPGPSGSSPWPRSGARSTTPTSRPRWRSARAPSAPASTPRSGRCCAGSSGRRRRDLADPSRALADDHRRAGRGTGDAVARPQPEPAREPARSREPEEPAPERERPRRKPRRDPEARARPDLSELAGGGPVRSTGPGATPAGCAESRDHPAAPTCSPPTASSPCTGCRSPARTSRPSRSCGGWSPTRSRSLSTGGWSSPRHREVTPGATRCERGCGGRPGADSRRAAVDGDARLRLDGPLRPERVGLDDRRRADPGQVLAVHRPRQPGRERGHAPAPDCTCGLYSMHPWPEQTSEVASSLLGGSDLAIPVMGIVEAWGRIEVHEDGFRAEYARPHALVLFTDSFPDDYAEILAVLAATYRVGVVRVQEAGSLVLHCAEHAPGMDPAAVERLLRCAPAGHRDGRDEEWSGALTGGGDGRGRSPPSSGSRLGSVASRIAELAMDIVIWIVAIVWYGLWVAAGVAILGAVLFGWWEEPPPPPPKPAPQLQGARAAAHPRRRLGPLHRARPQREPQARRGRRLPVRRVPRPPRPPPGRARRAARGRAAPDHPAGIDRGGLRRDRPPAGGGGQARGSTSPRRWRARARRRSRSERCGSISGSASSPPGCARTAPCRAAGSPRWGASTAGSAVAGIFTVGPVPRGASTQVLYRLAPADCTGRQPRISGYPTPERRQVLVARRARPRT